MTNSLDSSNSSNLTCDITLVVNVHKEGRQLHPTIRSAIDTIERANKAGLETELLVLMDTPDNDTRTYCAEYLPLNTRIEEIAVKDLGLARNAAVELARGQHIAFLDGDDLFLANWLEEAYKFMLNDKRELVLHPNLIIFFEMRNSLWKLIDQEDPVFSNSVLIEHNLWPALSFAKRSTYLQTPYRESRLKDGFGYEDWLFNCDTIAKGIIHKIVPGTIHCIREKSWKNSLLKETISSNSIIAPTDLFALAWQKSGSNLPSAYSNSYPE